MKTPLAVISRLVSGLARAQERRMRRRAADYLLRRDDLHTLLLPSRLSVEDLLYWERTGEPRPPHLRVVPGADVTTPEGDECDPVSGDGCVTGRAA